MRDGPLIRQTRGNGTVMRRDEKRATRFVQKRKHDVDNPSRGLRIELSRRFIGKHKARRENQRPGDCRTLRPNVQ